MVKQHLLKDNHDRHYTEFVASFVNDYGLCCDFTTIQEILCELENEIGIKIIRYPAYKKKKKKSSFWEEKVGHTIIIRRQ